MNIINDEKFSRMFFRFFKYNVISDKDELSDKDEIYYKEFLSKISELKKSLEDNESTSASNVLGSMMKMFGFNRHYCSISGQPIIGKYYKINSSLVSKEAYDSYKIVQQMEELDKKS